jgi:hypothetical protein
MQTITVREYARLTTDVIEPSLDAATISKSAFDWLCKLYSEFKKSGASLLHFEGRRCLKLDNYVGVLETPCGTCLEILPKHKEELACITTTRILLRKMITTAYDVKPREADQAALELYQDLPLSEWVMRCFLDALDILVKRGIRSDYERIEEVEPFLRGQLDLVKQLRQPPGRQHLFHVRYDVLSPNRPENRLLKSALIKVARHVRDPGAWRLAQELREWLHEIPESKHIGPDFHRWQSGSLAGQVLCFIRTSPFRHDEQYSRSITVPLRRPSADTAVIVEAALAGLRAIYKEGFQMAKAGVMLLELQSDTLQQQELSFDWEGRDSTERTSLMTTLDKINLRYGRGTVSIASAGLAGDRRVWSMKQERRTPGYTTDWKGLAVARA